MIFISRIKKTLSKKIKDKIIQLGFMNYYIHHVHGPKERLLVGNNTSTVNTIFNTRSGQIEIGNYVLFGHNCMVLTGKHNFTGALNDITKIREVPTSGRDIKIGDGTWITSGCIILGGVEIGRHCVVMAGSVVTKNIPDYSIVAGVPAKIISKNLG